MWTKIRSDFGENGYKMGNKLPFSCVFKRIKRLCLFSYFLYRLVGVYLMFFLQEEVKMISTGDKLVDENRYEPQADPAAMETEVQNPPKNKLENINLSFNHRWCCLTRLWPCIYLVNGKKLFLLIIWSGKKEPFPRYFPFNVEKNKSVPNNLFVQETADIKPVKQSVTYDVSTGTQLQPTKSDI